MSSIQIGPAGMPATPALLGAMAAGTDRRTTDWIEATMRANEVPSVVDLAKRPDARNRLLRLLDL